MSDLTRAAHRFGLLGDGGPSSGSGFGLLGDLLHLPLDVARTYVTAYQAQPELWQNRVAMARLRMQALGQLAPLMAGQQPDQAQAQSGGIDVAGVGQDVADPMNAPPPMTPPPGASPPSSPPPQTPAQRFAALQGPLAMATLAGVPGADQAATVLRPHYSNVNGRMVNDANPSDQSERVGVNLSNVNGFQVDTQDPANSGRYFPQLPESSQPLYDENGRLAGVRLLDGTVQAIAQRAGAERGAQQANTVVSGHDRQGREVSGYAGNLYGNAPGTGGGGGGVLVGQSPADAAYENHTAEDAATQFNAWQTAGASAPGRIANYQAVGQLLQNFNGNQFSGTAADVQRIAESMGIHLAPGLSAQEAATGLINNMVLQARNPANGGGLPGNTTPQELRFLEQSLPGLANSAAGRRQLVQILVAQANRDIARSTAAQQWQDRYGRIDRPDSSGRHFNDYWTIYMQRNPLIPRQRSQRPPGVH